MSNILTAVPGHTAEPGNTGVTGYQLDRQEMHCSPGTGVSVHVFKSIVCSQALQGVMINSRTEWNIEYLRELRTKFEDQGYPLQLINGEFNRALEIDRKDLLFNKNRKPKRIIIAPLVITYNPGNPNFRKWIQE